MGSFGCLPMKNPLLAAGFFMGNLSAVNHVKKAPGQNRGAFLQSEEYQRKPSSACTRSRLTPTSADVIASSDS